LCAPIIHQADAAPGWRGGGGEGPQDRERRTEETGGVDALFAPLSRLLHVPFFFPLVFALSDCYMFGMPGLNAKLTLSLQRFWRGQLEGEAKAAAGLRASNAALVQRVMSLRVFEMVSHLVLHTTVSHTEWLGAAYIKR
jgi:hypothetical protein